MGYNICKKPTFANKKMIIMKKTALFLLVLIIASNAYAQDKEDKQLNKMKLTQSDQFRLDIYTDIWMNLPSDTTMKTKQINRGASVSYMREIPFGRSNFSFAAGIGISCHNIYNDGQPDREFTTDTLGQISYTGKTVFYKIPEKVGTEEIDVKNNKLAVTYADIPIEFRYRTKNNQFKLYLGAKFGLTLTSYNKYHGDDFKNDPTHTIKVKTYKIPNIETLHYGITLRIGWKYVQAYGYYSLSTLFKKGKGPEMYPISAGLTFTPF